MKRRSLPYALLALLLVAAAVALLFGGRALVVNSPGAADAIVVLEGDADRRPAVGAQFLAQGMAPRMLLDASSSMRLYQWSEADLARQWVATLPPPLAARIAVEAEDQNSTKLEADWLGPRLRAANVKSVLLVTSEFHTRRALAVFRHELPGIQFRVAAAPDPSQFGVEWWRHRQWAKHAVYEWLSWIWWEGVDRWRR